MAEDLEAVRRHLFGATSDAGTYRMPTSLALSCPVLAPISVTRIGHCSDRAVHLLDLLRSERDVP